MISLRHPSLGWDCLLLAFLLVPLSAPAPALAQSQQEVDGYDAMLGYLNADSHIDAQAFSGSNGILSVNQAAGDLNLQANLHGIAVGEHASTNIDAMQLSNHDQANDPMHAQVRIGGEAFAGASGIASINQASGSRNMELNSMQIALAEQGIRETSNAAMATSAAFASAGEQYVSRYPQATRKVAVEASALRGFDGVLQLNQVAGSGNATENRVSVSVQGSP